MLSFFILPYEDTVTTAVILSVYCFNPLTTVSSPLPEPITTIFGPSE